MSLTVRFGADEYEMKTSWAASQEFDKRIGDPLQMAMKLHQGDVSVFRADSVVRAIWIGIKHGGGKLTENEVGELCHKNGIVNYIAIAQGYLFALVSGGPEDAEEDEAEDKKK